MSTGLQRQADVEALWLEFRGPMLAFINRRVRNRETAEDILQDVIVSIHRHADDLSHTSSVSGWIHQIARNAIIDHYRRAAVRHEHPAGSSDERDRPAPTEPDADPDGARGELAACLDPLLNQLPTVYQQALRLTDLNGMTQADAAEQLGLSVSGMKSRVQRGRAQLKSLLTNCCAIELDRRGAVLDYHPRHSHGSCSCRPDP